MLGSEGAGLAEGVRAVTDLAVAIPMNAPVESLNVAVSAGLLAYEARRQRTHGSGSRQLMGLFDDDHDATGEARGRDVRPPLADRMRPRTLDEIVGQDALLAPGRPLREAIERRRAAVGHPLGPARYRQDDAGARYGASHRAHISSPTAPSSSGIKEIKAVMAEAEAARRRLGRRTILFVDEIHRFNKAQQDAFLPRVEAGDLVLIGATTENPSFEVNAALLSRSKVYVLQPLDQAATGVIVQRAWVDVERGLARPAGALTSDGVAAIARYASGDARVALNALELVAGFAERRSIAPIDAALVADLLEKRALLYDKSGEEHFNIISALHKSLRNSDPDAAVYWLARMLEAGEDPMYVARRLVRFASEDVGHADPQALPIAVAAAARPRIRPACPRPPRRWPRPPSTWPRRPRATPYTGRTARRPSRRRATSLNRCPTTCATLRRPDETARVRSRV